MATEKRDGASTEAGSAKKKVKSQLDYLAGRSERRPDQKLKRGLSRGFSLVEMMVVVVILAILMAVGMLAFDSTVPAYQLRSSAKGALSVLQSARLQANNLQKPVRVVFDCRNHDPSDTPPDPCTVRTYIAVFENTGKINSWIEAPSTRRDINGSIDIESGSGGPTAGSHAKLFWAVFLPSGRVLASHSPFHLVFGSRNVSSDTNWELSLSNISGRASLSKQ